MFNEKTKVTLWGKDYNVSFPLPGQIFEIESLKNFLTANQYGVMARTNTVESNYLLDLVDSIATFSVLIPEIKELLPKKSYLDMPLDQAKQIIISYRRDYENWYYAIRKDMMEYSKEIKPKKEEEEINIEDINNEA